jgi:hypothetical protein
MVCDYERFLKRYEQKLKYNENLEVMIRENKDKIRMVEMSVNILTADMKSFNLLFNNKTLFKINQYENQIKGLNDEILGIRLELENAAS